MSCLSLLTSGSFLTVSSIWKLTLNRKCLFCSQDVKNITQGSSRNVDKKNNTSSSEVPGEIIKDRNKSCSGGLEILLVASVMLLLQVWKVGVDARNIKSIPFLLESNLADKIHPLFSTPSDKKQRYVDFILTFTSCSVTGEKKIFKGAILP